MELFKRKKYIVDNDVENWGILEEYNNGITLRYEEHYDCIDLFVGKRKYGEKRIITDKERAEIDKIAEDKGFQKCKGLMGVFYRLDKFAYPKRTLNEIKTLVNESKIESINAKITHIDNSDYYTFLDTDNIHDQKLCIEVLNSLDDADIEFESNKADFSNIKIKNVEKWNEIAKKHYYTEKHGDVEFTIGRDVNDNLEYVELFVSFPAGKDKRNMIQEAYATREAEDLLDEADVIGMSEGTVVYTYEDIFFGRVK